MSDQSNSRTPSGGSIHSDTIFLVKTKADTAHQIQSHALSTTQ